VSYVEISDVSPQPSPTIGTTLTVKGKLFMSPELTTVSLDGKPASIVSLDENTIVLNAPPHNDATVVLEVKNSLGTTRVNVAYRSEFTRGDADGNGSLEITDGIAILAYLFQGGSTDCREALDVNDDGELEITDGINLLDFLFQGGIRPPEPFRVKGIDPTPDALYCGR
jgi:IPT/TIG domain